MTAEKLHEIATCFVWFGMGALGGGLGALIIGLTWRNLPQISKGSKTQQGTEAERDA